MTRSLIATAKSAWRRRKLKQCGILPVNSAIKREHGLSFYGDRTGVWPICNVLKAHGSIVYSFGLGDNISWELTLIEQHQAEVFAFDPTPQTATLMSTQTLPPALHYSPVGLADHCGEVQFFIPRKHGRFNYSVVQRGSKYPSESVRCAVKDFATLCQENAHHRVDIVKLDVEGSEMTALPGILDCDVVIGQLLIEFHYNYPGIQLSAAERLITRIKAAGFELFWCSERGYEFGFVHRSVIGF